MRFKLFTIAFLIPFSLVCIAEHLDYQTQDKDKGTVTLSDGRVVPFGSGVICNDECLPPVDKSPNKKLLIGIITTIIVVPSLILLLHHNDTSTIKPPTITPAPLPTPIPNVPATPVPESSSLLMVVSGIVAFALLLRNKKCVPY